MSDLLTHVLVVYVILTIVSWSVDDIEPYIGVGMVGAVIPDLSKIRLLIDADTVASVLDIPFSWFPIHRLGGVLVIAGMGSLLFSRERRRRAFLFLCFGAVTALLLDVGVVRANGFAPPYFYPFSWWQPPSADLYLSSDIWPAVVMVPVSVIVWLTDRRR